MVSSLEKKEIFTMFIRGTGYDIEKAMAICEDAEQKDIPMYLVSPRGVDITPLLHFSWRPEGIYVYDNDNPSDITNIYKKIHADRKLMDAVNSI